MNTQSGQPSSSPSDSDIQSSQTSDPSYTQLMGDVGHENTQASSQSETQAGSPESSVSVEKSPKDPLPIARHDKATSPGIVGFGDSSNDRSCLNNKTKKEPKKPNQRPKQQKVNNMSQNMSSSDISEDEFTEVTYKKRKQNKTPPNIGLQGRKQESFEELYLSNIAKRDNQSHKDIANEIKEYCKKQNLRVMSVWVVPNRVTEDTVGCKIRVPLRQVDDMLDGRMWPSDITCKRWRKKPPPSPSELPEHPDRSRPRTRSFYGARRPSRSYSRGTTGSRSRSGSHHSRQSGRKPEDFRSRSRSHNRRQYRDWFDGHGDRY